MMLGDRLDYWLLCHLAHDRNRQTEAALDAQWRQVSLPRLAQEAAKFSKVIPRFGGHFPLAPQLKYLDMGCGTGELSLAVALASGARVTGVDFMPRSIERAGLNAHCLGLQAQVDFHCRDLNAWQPPDDQRFDVLLSFDALEHIADPAGFLAKMADFMVPDGVAVVSFGPLFHSPFGDHLWDFFRFQIPWRGLLFSEAALLEVRREYFRPTDPARRFSDMAGGLNQMRYSEFVRAVEAGGWQFEFLAVNVVSGLFSPMRRLSAFLMRWPGVLDYLAHNVYAVLRRTRPEELAGA